MDSRMVVGWRAPTSMRTELVLDALEMAIWRRAEVSDGLVCHSAAGSQDTSLRYTDRWPRSARRPRSAAWRQLRQRAGRIGYRAVQDRADRPARPWRTLTDVELATAGSLDWFNHHRLHGEIGGIPPAELEAAYYRQPEAATAA